MLAAQDWPEGQWNWSRGERRQSGMTEKPGPGDQPGQGSHFVLETTAEEGLGWARLEAVVGSAKLGRGWRSQRSVTRDKMTEQMGCAAGLAVAFLSGGRGRPGFEHWLPFLGAG